MSSRAVVIGSSLAGLAAARVLADRFDEVLVLERDPRPEGAEPRKGAPQGRHVHALLKAGELAIEELFPGVMATIESRGSHLVDFGNDLRWHHHGVWKKRYQSGVRVHLQSRGLLEFAVRERVTELPNVRFRYETALENIEIEDGRAAAVTSKDAAGSHRQTVDLVVDASGRGSQLDKFLSAAGYETPFEEKVGIDLQYASQMIELVPRQRDFRGLLVYPTPPQGKRGGIIFPLEGGKHMATLIGWQGDHPPADWEGFTGESPAVYAQFIQVMNLLSGPIALGHPSVLGRVLPRLLGLSRAPQPALAAART